MGNTVGAMPRQRGVHLGSLGPAALALLIAVAASAAEAASPRLAVLPLNGTDTSGVAAALREDLGRDGAYRVDTEVDTVGLIRSARDLGLDCGPGDVACLVKLGVLGDVAFILAPWITADEQGASLELVLVDVARGDEKKRVQRRLTGNPQELARDALVELTDPDAYFASVVLEANVVGAAVLLDGATVGTTPLDGPLEVRPGTHQVRVVLEGYETFEADLPLDRGQRLPLSVELSPTRALDPSGAAPAAVDANRPPTPWVDHALNPFVVGGATATAALGAVAVGLGLVGGLSTLVVLLGHRFSVDATTRTNLVFPALVSTYAFWGFVLPVFLGGAAGTGALYGMLVLME